MDQELAPKSQPLTSVGGPLNASVNVGTTPVLAVPPLPPYVVDYQSITIVNTSTGGQTIYLSEQGLVNCASGQGITLTSGGSYSAAAQAPFFPTRSGIGAVASGAGGTISVAYR